MFRQACGSYIGRMTMRYDAMAMPDSERQGFHFMQHFELTHQMPVWQHDMCLYRHIREFFM
jgi:hypothetical protein